MFFYGRVSLLTVKKLKFILKNNKRENMKNKRIRNIVITTATAATIFGGITPVASFAKELPASSVTRIEFKNDDGEPISGNVNNVKLNKSGFVVETEVSFPDDAQPGDTVTYTINVPISLARSRMNLSNNAGTEIARMEATSSREQGTTVFTYTLLETAKNLTGRSVEMKMSTSNNPFPCSPT